MGHKAEIEILVFDSSYSRVIRGGDVKTFESEQQHLGKIDVVQRVCDVDLVLE